MGYMSDKFIIQGQAKLEGVINISGAKNSAGPILAATLLTKESCIVDNLPLVKDILNSIEILKSMGAEVEWLGEKKIRITAANVSPEKIAISLIGKSRVSVLLIGALLARFNEFKFTPPGGDRIGLRPITTHLDALGKLGAKVTRENSDYCFDGSNLKGEKIILKEFSVTATETLMIAAAGINGITVIKSAAAEPHVRALGEMLIKMGAEISGLGTHTITIKGSENLKGGEFSVLSDHIEAGTYFAIGAITPGTLELRNIISNDLDIFLEKMKDLNVRFEIGKDSLRVHYSPDLKPARIQTLPWPGFTTDVLPLIVPLLTQAQGKSLIHDPLYENRLSYVQELRKMGADIEIVDPHRAIVFGKTDLTGIEISSWDIRAGASLVVAGLIAKGETVVKDAYQIDRGYERMDQKLQNVGAKIKRVTE